MNECFHLEGTGARFVVDHRAELLGNLRWWAEHSETAEGRQQALVELQKVEAGGANFGKGNH